MTVKTVISAAKEFGVPERYSIMRRLVFLQPQIKHLEREIWGAQQRIKRGSDPLLCLQPVMGFDQRHDGNGWCDLPGGRTGAPVT